MSVEKVNLLLSGASGIDTVLTGPWKEARVQRVEAGETQTFRADGVEYAIFALSGNGRVMDAEDRTWHLSPGTAVALPDSGEATITTDGGACTFFVVELKIAS